MANYTKEFNLISLSLNNKYRSHIEIIALILEALKCGDTGRYSLMKHTSVNYSQLKKYLKLLSKIGFIETDIREDSVFYRASELGVAYLRQYGILRDMLLGTYSRIRSRDLIAAECTSMPLFTHVMKQKLT
jgi:predicted transcriptional regulator